MNLKTKLGRLTLPNPILVASGTFGYAETMGAMIDLTRLGGIVPKTVTLAPRPGNRMPRTVETTAGLLNAIGLDNDGIDEFFAAKLPRLRMVGVPILVSVAAKALEEAAVFAEKFAAAKEAFEAVDRGRDFGVAAIELNVSCPNVSGGVDFGTNPSLCEKMVGSFRREMEKTRVDFPLIVKLTPNVTQIAEIAKAAEAGGAEILSAINTLYGLAVDWRRHKPRIANGYAGYSGPAIRPVALRCVSQIFRAVSIPIIGIGGIETAEDVLEFTVAGASAVQVGTANFYKPGATLQILDELPSLLEREKIARISDLVGTLELA